MNGLLGNPWINIGAGLLAGDTMGEGMLLGMKGLREQQALKQREQEIAARAAYYEAQKAKAEQEAREAERAQRLQAHRQAFIQSQMGQPNQELAGPPQDPSLLGQSIGVGGGSGLLATSDRPMVDLAKSLAGYDLATGGMPPKEYMAMQNAGLPKGMVIGPDGKPMWDEEYLRGRKEIAGAGATNIDFGGIGNTPLNQPIDKGEAKSMRGTLRQLKHLEGTANRLEQTLKDNPGIAGGFRQLQAAAGSWIEQTGEFLDWEWARGMGQNLAGNMAVYRARGQSFINASKVVFMDNEGRLSNEDRARLENASAALDKATTGRQVLAVLQDVREQAWAKAATYGANMGPGGQADAPLPNGTALGEEDISNEELFRILGSE